MRACVASMRGRWSGLPKRRKRALIVIAGVLLLVTVLRRRGAPLVQVNVDLTFHPIATTAVSLFGPASISESALTAEE